MTLLADLEEFVADHRAHGTMIGDAQRRRGTATCSPWRARVGWRLSGGVTLGDATDSLIAWSGREADRN